MALHIDLASAVAGPVAVLGLGRSGHSAAKALGLAGITVRAWDDAAPVRADAAAAGISIHDLRGESFQDVRLLVLSPGIPHTWPVPHPVVARAHAADVEIVCDVELLMRACPDARYVGVTGTNGKSTTTALIGHLLSAAGPTAVGGNIGTPALDLEPLGGQGTYVLELSSYQLELMPSGAVNTAVLLNISPDHTERHGSIDGYIAAKAHIFAGQDSEGTAVIGVDDESSRGLFDRLFEQRPGRVIAVSGHQPVDGGVYAEDGWLVDDRNGGAERILNLAELYALPGRHNAQNIAAAYAAVGTTGLSIKKIVWLIRNFPGLSHRLEALGSIDGIPYVNDSKATNMAAVANALSCYRDIVWIAGGQPKAAMDLAEIAEHLPRVRLACLIGAATSALVTQLDGRVPIMECGNLTSALECAAASAKQSDPRPVVLLSPGCASFDQFANFEERGETFRRLVAALPGVRGRPAEGGAPC